MQNKHHRSKQGSNYVWANSRCKKLLKVFNQCFCILQVCNWFPTIFLWATMLPSNQILSLILHSAFPQNLLHFILQFSFNNFRSFCCRWRTIPSLEQRGMKHRMHLHGRWKDEAVWHSQRLFHCKRAYPARLKLLSGVAWKVQIGGAQQHQVSNTEGQFLPFFIGLHLLLQLRLFDCISSFLPASP